MRDLNLRDRIKGVFLGVGIGDALGAPVETMSAEAIGSTYGRLASYVDCEHHRYLKGLPAGSVTDDTQLTLAVAEAIIKTGDVDIEAIAAGHVTAFDDPEACGYGSSTREAIQRIKAGVPLDRTGFTTQPNRGMGNGVAMKAAPLGVYAAVTGRPVSDHMEQFSLLTHHTNMAVASGAAWAEAIRFILTEEWRPLDFFAAVYGAALWGKSRGRVQTKDNLCERLVKLYGAATNPWPPHEIIAKCGGGSPYVYDSLPFALHFFLRGPDSFETVLDTVNAGGDADTTGSLVASAIGAKHGTAIFPKDLVDGLRWRDRIIDVAERFCDRLGVA